MSVKWNVNFLNYCEDPGKYFLPLKFCSPWLPLPSGSCSLDCIGNKTTFFVFSSLPPHLHTDNLTVCCTIFLMRDVLLFQSEQGWTHPIPTLEHMQYLFESYKLWLSQELQSAPTFCWISGIIQLHNHTKSFWNSPYLPIFHSKQRERWHIEEW